MVEKSYMRDTLPNRFHQFCMSTLWLHDRWFWWNIHTKTEEAVIKFT